MQIEIARESDIDALIELLTLLFEHEVEFTPDPQRQRQGLGVIIRNQEIGETIILKYETRIISMVNLLYTIITAIGARVSWLEDMVIHPDYRNSSAGTLLIESAMRFSQQQGCLRITLLTDRYNCAAQRFYERNDFHRSSMVPMRRRLDKLC